MLTLREAARTLSVTVLAALMAYGTIVVTFFNDSARQGVNAPASVEPWS